MQGRDVSETARHHKNHPHMVRHDNKQQGVYERNRTYAMPTVAERLVEVAEQRKVQKKNVLTLLPTYVYRCLRCARDRAPR